MTRVTSWIRRICAGVVGLAFFAPLLANCMCQPEPAAQHACCAGGTGIRAADDCCPCAAHAARPETKAIKVTGAVPAAPPAGSLPVSVVQEPAACPVYQAAALSPSPPPLVLRI